MNSSNDNDLSDTMSLIDADPSSDFEIVDYDTESEGRPFAHSSAPSEIASSLSDITDSLPPSPQLDASQFHFPDPEAVFARVTLDSSSLHTLMATSQQRSVEQQVPEREVEGQQTGDQLSNEAVPAWTLDHTTKEQEPEIEEPSVGTPPQSVKQIIMQAPKKVWIVLLLTTLLISIKTGSMLAPQPLMGQRRDGAAARYQDSRWITKFASPAPTAPAPFSDLRVANVPPRADSTYALAPKPSLSSLSVVEKATSHKATQQSGSASKPKSDRRQHRDSSAALQPTPNASKKSLTVVGAPSAMKGGCQRCAKEPRIPEFRFGRKPVGKRRRPNKPCYACHASKANWDSMMYSLQVEGTYLANATTTTWAFWLAELQSYDQLVLRPALAAARQQAREAARMAQRYHSEQLLPAFETLRQHAKQTAQQMENFANRYNDEQVRPAFASLRQHAKHTARQMEEFASRYNDEQVRPAFAYAAQYHDKVLSPKVRQMRQQAREAARMTSVGLEKAVKRFAADAKGTVKQVKDRTNLDLEAIGVDEYLGFVISTFKGVMLE